MERIIMLLGESIMPAYGCFIVAQGDEEVRRYAIGLLTELRSAGIAAESVPEKSFKAQMRRAGKSGYPLCAIIGEDELKDSMVTIKNLEDSSQVKIARADAREKIAALLKDRGENA
jgi:histidyl-tRNA synthetase